MEYLFFGSEAAKTVHAVNKLYEGIDTPCDLYDVLSELWCQQTCAPRLRDRWSKANKTLGQCSITAFLVQDIFGGEVYAVKTAHGSHCYNKVGEAVFDLTSEQFGSKAKDLIYDCSLVQDRESDIHFNKEEKRTRYAKLKELLENR